MKILLAGGTRVLGRRALPLLVAAGHEVRALARTEEKAASLRAAGAEPLVADLFDGVTMRAAMRDRDAVLHIATKIPPTRDARSRSAWAENDRLRAEGTRILVDAALDTRVELFLKESVTFTYPDCGADPITEEGTPLSAEPGWLTSTYLAEAETRRFEEHGRRAVILRYGAFHDASTSQIADAIGLLRRRVAPVLGPPDSFWSIVHVEDAATALVAALSAPSAAYNVVDDEPLTRRAYANAAASALGLAPPWFLPVWLPRLVAGGAADTLMRSQRVSNERFKRATGWAPRYPSARETWAEVARALGPSRSTGGP